MWAPAKQRCYKHLCFYTPTNTHYAGAELLVCDVQRVSVSVVSPARPFFAYAIPALQVRYLQSLTHTQLLGPYPCLLNTPALTCIVLTRVLCVV